MSDARRRIGFFFGGVTDELADMHVYFSVWPDNSSYHKQDLQSGSSIIDFITSNCIALLIAIFSFWDPMRDFISCISTFRIRSIRHFYILPTRPSYDVVCTTTSSVRDPN